MKIRYASAHKWWKPVTADPLELFGKNMREKIRSTCRKIDTFDIRAETKELDEEFLSWFIPLYETRIKEKENPVVFDIRKKTLDREEKNYSYYSMALYENGEPIGGTIFSARNERFSVAYRTYAHNWKYAALPANPSQYTEYLISKLASEMGKQTIIHGKDRNPYGIHSSIGLAAFKLSAGCRPRKSKVFEIKAIDTETISRDAFILEYPGDSTDDITHAYLVTSRETEAKWSHVGKYPERLSVDVIYRD